MSSYRFDRDGSAHLSDSSEDDYKKSAANEDYAPPKKQRRCATSSDQESKPVGKDNNIGANIMAMMGYKPGTGLGKHNQGIAEPIKLSNQRGRTGLGHEGSKALIHDPTIEWDDSSERKNVKEKPEFFEAFSDEEDDSQDNYLTRQSEVDRIKPLLEKKVGTDAKKMEIENEIDVVDKDLLIKMLDAKNVFNDLSDRALREARARANPYETIASGIFQNRAAMKAANMDAIFNFIFSSENIEHIETKSPLNIHKDGSNMLHRNLPLFYFADVCAGPGGFSEYQLWRKNFYNAKGFGFTLKNKDDFKLTKFIASSPLFFEPYYGVRGDGDVTRPENIDSFENVVLKGTDGLGVHLMMADGGFSVEGQENIQEILSKRIYLCQLLVSLCIVREGGNFYCKLFDIFTRFSYELVFLMRLCYKKVCIHKPHTSRPANSERYIVCIGHMRKFSAPIKKYLKQVNKTMQDLRDSKNESVDVQSMLPHHFGNNLTKTELSFMNYMTDSNNTIAKRQIHYLQKYRTFACNNGLIDKDQADLRENCMKYWKVPYDMHPQDRRRPRRDLSGPEQLFSKFKSDSIYGKREMEFKLCPFESSFRSIFYNCARQGQHVHEEYRLVWATESRDNQTTSCKAPFMLVATSDAVYIYEQGLWQRQDRFTYRVPGPSILYVELTSPMTEDRNGLAYTIGVHTIIRVLDAAVLAGDDISHLSIDDRNSAIRKFCKAAELVENKVYFALPEVQDDRSRGRYGRQQQRGPPQFKSHEYKPMLLKPADVFTFKQIVDSPPRTQKFRKDIAILHEEDKNLFKVTGLHVLRFFKTGWSAHFSKKQNMVYAYTTENNKNTSVFSDKFIESGCLASFWDVTVGPPLPAYRMFWRWKYSVSENYGPNQIMNEDSHSAGPTIPELRNRISEFVNPS